jgi:hypothetical protein
VAKHKNRSDDIFGGWVNLDLPGSKPQQFQCIEKSHLDGSQDEEGFAKVKKDIVKGRKSVIMTVPPGHWIVFFQNIIHNVVKQDIKHTSIRVYTGFRLTKKEGMLFSENADRIRRQASILIPSGQEARMYAGNHQSLHSYRVAYWSAKTFPETIIQRKSFDLVQKNLDRKAVQENQERLEEWQCAYYHKHKNLPTKKEISKQKELLSKKHLPEKVPENKDTLTVSLSKAPRHFTQGLAEMKVTPYAKYRAIEKHILEPHHSWNDLPLTWSGTSSANFKFPEAEAISRKAEKRSRSRSRSRDRKKSKRVKRIASPSRSRSRSPGYEGWRAQHRSRTRSRSVSPFRKQEYESYKRNHF